MFSLSSALKFDFGWNEKSIETLFPNETVRLSRAYNSQQSST